jgi:hypothetical protein
MNDAAQYVIGVALAFAGAVSGVLATLWNARRGSPTSQAKIAGSYAELVTSISTRLAVLEARVVDLERELDAYHRLHGPLPLPQPNPATKRTSP